MCSVPRIASITRAIERSFQFRTGSALMTRTGCLRAFLNIYIVEEREAYSIKKVIRLCQNLTTKCASFWPSLFYGTERNLSPHYSTGRSGICHRIILWNGDKSVVALFYGTERNLSLHHSTETNGTLPIFTSRI